MLTIHTYLGSWMLCNALPELREDGSVERVVSSITDISHLKFAESVNFNRVEEARLGFYRHDQS